MSQTKANSTLHIVRIISFVTMLFFGYYLATQAQEAFSHVESKQTSIQD